MHACGRRFVYAFSKILRNARKSGVRIGDDKKSAECLRIDFGKIILCDQHSGGAGGDHLREIFGIGQKSQLARPGAVKRRKPLNLTLAIAGNAAAKTLRQLIECEAHGRSLNSCCLRWKSAFSCASSVCIALRLTSGRSSPFLLSFSVIDWTRCAILRSSWSRPENSCSSCCCACWIAADSRRIRSESTTAIRANGLASENAAGEWLKNKPKRTRRRQ